MKIPQHPNQGTETQCQEVPITFPPQQQDVQPGLEHLMNPQPIADNPSYIGSDKLKGKVAIITGGDSGIGRAVAIGFAKEGANMVITYVPHERADAEKTKQLVEEYGQQAIIIAGDLKDRAFSEEVVKLTMGQFNAIDTLVLNQAVQYPQQSITDITDQQLDTTYRTNIYPFFYMTQAALPHMKKGSTIISTASITAYEGNPQLLDYSTTKGAIVTFTRSLSLQLAGKGIRVNAVAPGPIWTPLIVSSFTPDKVKHFGADTPMKRAGQPFELAPTYIYLASDDSSYVSGQVLHVNGGTIVGS